MAVDQKKFRKCADTGFCRRNRERTAATPSSPVSKQWAVDSKQKVVSSGVVQYGA